MKGAQKGAEKVKIMKATVITIQFESTSTTLATVKGMLEAMNIKYGEKSYEWEDAPRIEAETKSETKKVAETKKTPKAKAKAKSNDDFDRELYLKCASALDVVGKHGVYHFARKTVYDAMSEVNKSKSHRLTKNVIKSLKAQLLTVAQTEGIQWYIDKVATAQ